FVIMPPPPPTSTLFPYTTLFRSSRLEGVWTLVPARLDGDPKNWLLLRKDDAAPEASAYGLMLATSVDDLPGGDGWLFEVKWDGRSEEHTSELQSRFDLVCRLLLE